MRARVQHDDEQRARMHGHDVHVHVQRGTCGLQLRDRSGLGWLRVRAPDMRRERMRLVFDLPVDDALERQRPELLRLHDRRHVQQRASARGVHGVRDLAGARQHGLRRLRRVLWPHLGADGLLHDRQRLHELLLGLPGGKEQRWLARELLVPRRAARKLELKQARVGCSVHGLGSPCGDLRATMDK